MTDAERIAAWGERRADGAELPAKRPQGRAGLLTHEQKQAIRLVYLEQRGRTTRQALAAQFNVNRDTVAACLQGPAFESLQRQLDQEVREGALQRLKAHVGLAADAWCDSIEVAAAKGDHRPAKELLLHTKVIEPVTKDEGAGLTILIGGCADDVRLLLVAPADARALPKLTE